MKTFYGILVKFARYTFALYSCITVLFLSVANSLSIKETPDWTGIFLLSMQILLFSALAALIHAGLGAIKKLNSGLSALLCALLTYGAFYLCFFAMIKGSAQPINVVVVSTVFFVAYAVIRGLGAAASALICRKSKKDAEYVSIYGKTENKED